MCHFRFHFPYYFIVSHILWPWYSQHSLLESVLYCLTFFLFMWEWIFQHCLLYWRVDITSQFNVLFFLSDKHSCFLIFCLAFWRHFFRDSNAPPDFGVIFSVICQNIPSVIDLIISCEFLSINLFLNIWNLHVLLFNPLQLFQFIILVFWNLNYMWYFPLKIELIT